MVTVAVPPPMMVPAPVMVPPVMVPAPVAMPRPIMVPVPVIVPPPVVVPAPAPIAVPHPMAMPTVMPSPPAMMPHVAMHDVVPVHRLGGHRLRLRGRFGRRSRLGGRRRGAAAAAASATGLLCSGRSGDECRREQSGGQNSQHTFLLIGVSKRAVLRRRAFTACWYCTGCERQMKRAGAWRSSS